MQIMVDSLYYGEYRIYTINRRTLWSRGPFIRPWALPKATRSRLRWSRHIWVCPRSYVWSLERRFEVLLRSKFRGLGLRRYSLKV